MNLTAFFLRWHLPQAKNSDGRIGKLLHTYCSCCVRGLGALLWSRPSRSLLMCRCSERVLFCVDTAALWFPLESFSQGNAFHFQQNSSASLWCQPSRNGSRCNLSSPGSFHKHAAFPVCLFYLPSLLSVCFFLFFFSSLQFDCFFSLITAYFWAWFLLSCCHFILLHLLVSEGLFSVRAMALFMCPSPAEIDA